MIRIQHLIVVDPDLDATAPDHHVATFDVVLDDGSIKGLKLYAGPHHFRLAESRDEVHFTQGLAQEITDLAAAEYRLRIIAAQA